MPPEKRKRRVLSCASCRRLRTRCEKLGQAEACSRCDRLRIDCSFLGSLRPRVTGTAVRRSGGDADPPGGSPAADQSVSVEQRIGEIETAVAGLRSLLVQQASSSPSIIAAAASVAQNVPIPDRPSADATTTASRYSDDGVGIGGLPDPPVAFSRTAPISVIRDMKLSILGTGLSPQVPEDIDCLSLGIISESLCQCLIQGFHSLRLERYGLDIDPWAVQHVCPVLFASCLLAGLHTIPSLCQSRLHDSLYAHTRDLLSKILLRTPLSIECLQALLIFSHWQLVPAERNTYIDSWLLGGMGILHGALTTDFEAAPGSLSPNLHGRQRRNIRAWNNLCLTHLRFSVGTGQCPIITYESLRCQDDSPGDNDDSWDLVLAAEAKLYLMLYHLITSGIRKARPGFEGEDIEAWKLDHCDLIDSDSSGSLLLAYSCAHLILARHVLKTITNSPPDALRRIGLSPAEIETHTDAQANRALEHSLKILRSCHDIMLVEGNTTPAFIFLMCTTAAITIIEFPQRLEITDTPGVTHELMEDILTSIKNSRRDDKVFQWAVDVMRMSRGGAKD